MFVLDSPVLTVGLLIGPCVLFFVLLLKMNNMLVVCEFY